MYNNTLDFAYGDAKHRIGPSYAVLAHPRVVRFAEMEYTVPAELGVDCLRDVLDPPGRMLNPYLRRLFGKS